MTKHGPGGNKDAIRNALQNAVDGFGEKHPEAADKLVGAAWDAAGVADSVVKKIKGSAGQLAGGESPAGGDRGELLSKLAAQAKDKGLMAAGGLLAADGLRRMAKKDADGKRHIAKGAVEAGVGIGAFTAAVLKRRAGQQEQGQGGPEIG